MAEQINTSRKALAEAMVQFRRRSWTTEGLHDAFVFVLECLGNVERIQARIEEIESYLRDSFLLEGPMKPGAGPRIYREGYLAGLREALEIISRQAESPETYALEQQNKHVMAEDKNARYEANHPDNPAS